MAREAQERALMKVWKALLQTACCCTPIRLCSCTFLSLQAEQHENERKALEFRIEDGVNALRLTEQQVLSQFQVRSCADDRWMHNHGCLNRL